MKLISDEEIRKISGNYYQECRDSDKVPMAMEIARRNTQAQLESCERELKKMKDEIGEDIITTIVNFYIPDKDNQERAFELWRTYKKRLEREGD